MNRRACLLAIALVLVAVPATAQTVTVSSETSWTSVRERCQHCAPYDFAAPNPQGRGQPLQDSAISELVTVRFQPTTRFAVTVSTDVAGRPAAFGGCALPALGCLRLPVQDTQARVHEFDAEVAWRPPASTGLANVELVAGYAVLRDTDDYVSLWDDPYPPFQISETSTYHGPLVGLEVPIQRTRGYVLSQLVYYPKFANGYSWVYGLEAGVKGGVKLWGPIDATASYSFRQVGDYGYRERWSSVGIGLGVRLGGK